MKLNLIVVGAMIIYSSFPSRVSGKEDITINASNKLYQIEGSGNNMFPNRSIRKPELNRKSVPTPSNHCLSIRENPFRFSSYYLDKESGNYYCTARYYCPELMKFINRDSFDLSNRYSYCEGNPVSSIDPMGHDPNVGNYILGFMSIAGCIPAGIITGGTGLLGGIAIAGAILGAMSTSTAICGMFNSGTAAETLNQISLWTGLAGIACDLASGGGSLIPCFLDQIPVRGARSAIELQQIRLTVQDCTLERLGEAMVAPAPRLTEAQAREIIASEGVYAGGSHGCKRIEYNNGFTYYFKPCIYPGNLEAELFNQILTKLKYPEHATAICTDGYLITPRVGLFAEPATETWSRLLPSEESRFALCQKIDAAYKRIMGFPHGDLVPCSEERMYNAGNIVIMGLYRERNVVRASLVPIDASVPQQWLERLRPDLY